MSKPKNKLIQQEGLRKRGRSALTEGQTNILLADLIDGMAEQKTTRELMVIIKDFYKKTINKDLAKSSYYEIITRAKSKWLTNVNLPSLENYKKEMFVKSELLEENVKLNSQKDIVDQANTIRGIWTYKDNLIGLNDSAGNDSVIISINMDKKEIINSLDIPDADVIDITPDK